MEHVNTCKLYFWRKERAHEFYMITPADTHSWQAVQHLSWQLCKGHGSQAPPAEHCRSFILWVSGLVLFPASSLQGTYSFRKQTAEHCNFCAQVNCSFTWAAERLSELTGYCLDMHISPLLFFPPLRSVLFPVASSLSGIRAHHLLPQTLLSESPPGFHSPVWEDGHPVPVLPPHRGQQFSCLWKEIKTHTHKHDAMVSFVLRQQ